MDNNMSHVISELGDIASRLKAKADSELDGLRQSAQVSQHDSPTQTSNNVSAPDRPWKVGGAVSGGIGLLGILISSHSVWPYALAVAGAVCYGIGVSKSASKDKMSSNTTASSSNVDLGSIADTLASVARSIESGWKDGVESLKLTVQNEIALSDVSEDAKRSALNLTYNTERLHIDYNSAVDELFRSGTAGVSNIVSRFKETVNKEIDRAAAAQSKIYLEIKMLIAHGS